MYKANQFLCFCLALAACSTAPDDNQLEFNRKGNAFEGVAGAGWTDEELQSGAYFGAICPEGLKVANVQVERDENGIANFSGTCEK